MSIVTVQIGQCGNQVGCELFSSLSMSQTSSSCFFVPSRSANSSPFARSVLIDMEPKVIRDCLEFDSGDRFRFRPGNAFCKQSGSANNWAYGYRKQGPSVRDTVLSHVRREVERCDSLAGILVISSLAGGTGSGVGTFVTELLREWNPGSAPLCNMIVWPYESGEITIQNYNTLLSLGHLSEDSDCIWFHLNDFCNDTCVQQLAIPSPNFSDINRVIASTSASALLSAELYQSTPSPLFPTPYRPLRDIVDHLCAHPGYKFLNAKFYPFVPEGSRQFHSDRWGAVLKQTYQRLRSKHEVVSWHIPQEHCNRSLAATLFVRGRDDGVLVEDSDMTDFQRSLLPFLCPPAQLFSGWYEGTQQELVRVYHSDEAFTVDRSACILSNSQVIVRPLDNILERSSSMFQSNAYLHQYEKYGIERDEFVSLFRRLEQVLQDYRDLNSS